MQSDNNGITIRPVHDFIPWRLASVTSQSTYGQQQKVLLAFDPNPMEATTSDTLSVEISGIGTPTCSLLYRNDCANKMQVITEREIDGIPDISPAELVSIHQFADFAEDTRAFDRKWHHNLNTLTGVRFAAHRLSIVSRKGTCAPITEAVPLHRSTIAAGVKGN